MLANSAHLPFSEVCTTVSCWAFFLTVLFPSVHVLGQDVVAATAGATTTSTSSSSSSPSSSSSAAPVASDLCPHASSSSYSLTVYFNPSFQPLSVSPLTQVLPSTLFFPSEQDYFVKRIHHTKKRLLITSHSLDAFENRHHDSQRVLRRSERLKLQQNHRHRQYRQHDPRTSSSSSLRKDKTTRENDTRHLQRILAKDIRRAVLPTTPNKVPQGSAQTQLTNARQQQQRQQQFSACSQPFGMQQESHWSLDPYFCPKGELHKQAAQKKDEEGDDGLALLWQGRLKAITWNSTLSSDGWQLPWIVSVFAPFCLFHLLLPSMPLSLNLSLYPSPCVIPAL